MFFVVVPLFLFYVQHITFNNQLENKKLLTHNNINVFYKFRFFRSKMLSAHNFVPESSALMVKKEKSDINSYNFSDALDVTPESFNTTDYDNFEFDDFDYEDDADPKYVHRNRGGRKQVTIISLYYIQDLILDINRKPLNLKK